MKDKIELFVEDSQIEDGPQCLIDLLIDAGIPVDSEGTLKGGYMEMTREVGSMCTKYIWSK